MVSYSIYNYALKSCACLESNVLLLCVTPTQVYIWQPLSKVEHKQERLLLRLLCYASSSFTLNWGHPCLNCLEDDVAKYVSTCDAKYKGENGIVQLITDNRVPTVCALNQKLGDFGRFLPPSHYGVYGQQGVPGYF